MIDSLHRAVVDRPDHLTGHRLYAYALVRAGRPAEAFAAVLAAIDQPYRHHSYAGGERTLADDAGMIGAAYAAAAPGKRAEIIAELVKRNTKLATTPSTRFILYWETDANDVDFHIQDARGGHAFYAQKTLASGGELYADITTGYGPECFAIPGMPTAGPYRLSINYYSQGPMGYGMGLLEVETFDGKGRMTFDDRPYVIMNDHAYVDLGVGPLDRSSGTSSRPRRRSASAYRSRARRGRARATARPCRDPWLRRRRPATDRSSRARRRPSDRGDRS